MFDIKRWRRKNGLTQEAIADKLNITRQAVSQMEKVNSVPYERRVDFYHGFSSTGIKLCDLYPELGSVIMATIASADSASEAVVRLGAHHE